MNPNEHIDFSLELTHEDLELLADAIISCVRETTTAYTKDILHITVIDIEQLDLDALAGELMGLTDPIGQLKKWLEELLKSIAKWIVDQLSGVIDTVKDWFEGAIDSAISGIKSFINELIRGVSTLVENVYGFVKDLADSISKSFESVFEQLKNLTTDITSWFYKVLDSLTTIGSKIIEGISTITKVLSDIGYTILDAISGVVDSIIKYVENVKNALSKAISEVYEFVKKIPDIIIETTKKIGDALGKFGETIQDLFKTALDFLGEIGKKLGEVFKFIEDVVSGAIETITDFINKNIVPWFEKVKKWVLSGLETFANTVKSFVEQVVGGIVAGIGKLTDLVKTGFDYVVKKVSEIIKPVFDALNWLKEQIQNVVLKPLFDAIERAKEFIAGLPKIIDWVKDAIEVVKNALEGIWDVLRSLPEIKKWLEDIWNLIKNNLWKKLTEDIPNAIKSIINELPKIPEKIPELAKEIWEKLVRPAYEYVLNKLVKPFIDMSTTVWNNVVNALTQLGARFTGFVNALAQLPTWLHDFVTKPLETISKVISSIREMIVKFVETISYPEKLVEHLKTLISKFMEGLSDIVTSFVNTVASNVKDWLPKTLNLVKEGLTRIGETVYNIVSGAIKTLLEHIGKPVVEFVANLIKNIVELIQKKSSPSLYELVALATGDLWRLYLGKLKEFFNWMIKEAHKDFVTALYKGFTFLIPLSIATMIARELIKILAELLSGIDFSVGITGVMVTLKNKLGDVGKRISELISRCFPDVARYLIIGHMIWWVEPTRCFTRYSLTEYVTIELPPLEHTLRSLQRHLVTPTAKEYYKIFTDQLRYGGIYKGFIERLYPLTDKLLEDFGSIKAHFDENYLSVVIRDRFGSPRKFPVTLIASIPTPSELARMMIRDIIQDPDHFKAVMALHGYHPDTAFMFYLLHFRYPSPEKLWEFIARGMSGMLWYTATKADENEAMTLIKKFNIKAEDYMPVSPSALNYNHQKLFEAFTKYMKWHDYIPVAWVPKFTSDNMIIKDVVVDIPTKIDQRWMVKWGIYQQLHELIGVKGTLPKKPIVEIIKEYIEKASGLKVETNIVYDLRLFCRTLQATGLHPAFVPVVAIAEAINALTDERTLLRTGFLNLYKEGFFTVKDLEDLLSGFFYVKFIVERLTIEKGIENMDWESKEVFFPVMFLPPERKLLELRAIFDRALDVLRDYMRALATGVRYLIIEAKEAIDRLKTFVKEYINKWFSEEVKKVTGIARELTVDETWASIYMKYFEDLRDIENIVRARYYVRYLLYATMRRFERGYITRNELLSIAENLRKMVKETPLFSQMIEFVGEKLLEGYIRQLKAEAIINKAKRRKLSISEAIKELMNIGLPEDVAVALAEARIYPYSISLTSLATLLEIVPEAWQYAIDSLGLFGFRKDEFIYWVKYMFRKPFKDELTLVRTRIYNALEEGIEHKELVKILDNYAIKPSIEVKEEGGELKAVVKVDYGEIAKKLADFYKQHKSTFEAYGISVEEWILYNLIAELERRRAGLKEYIPTPMMLATLLEYVKVPDELVEEVLEKRGIPKKWREIWRKYIEVRPLADDIRALLTPYRRAKVLGILPKDIEEKVRKYLEMIGYTKKELEILDLRIQIEELIQSYREYVPTPMMLATLAEYLPLPDDIIEDTLKRRRVPERWMKFWRDYIKIRPLADDVRRLISDYLRAKVEDVVPEDIEKEVLELAKKVGYTDKELEILKLRETLRKLIRESRVYIPTPLMLARLAEIMPVPDKFVEQVFRYRRVPEEWRGFWKEYIEKASLVDDVRRLITDYVRASVYTEVPSEIRDKIIGLARYVGWSDKELEILDLRIALRKLVREARFYVPTPMMLATIAEYVPEARKLMKQVFEYRRIPEVWRSIWAKYITIRPIINDIRRVLAWIERLYARFAIKPEDFRKVIESLKPFGYEDKEIELLVEAGNLARQYYAYRTVFGSPRQLVYMAEYSPMARQLAVKQIHQMIDALPVDDATKNFLKKMWEEFIRIRPVYDEVRRYVTELINAYAEELIDDATLRRELEELKKWGLDDYEIQFYIWLAQKRRARRELRQLRRMYTRYM